MATTGGVEVSVPYRTTPAEGRWIAKPQKVSWMVKFGAFVALFGQLPNLIKIIATPFLGSGGATILMFVVLILFLGALGWMAWRRRTVVRSPGAALVDGGFGDQFPAEVSIVADSKHLGTDRGVLWFADGLMGFSGEASSFVLAAWDVHAHRTGKAAYRGKPAMPAGAIELLGTPIPAHLIVSPLGKGGKKEFTERLRIFEIQSASADAERHWPPLVPYEEASALFEPGRE